MYKNHVLVLHENGGHHIAFTDRAKDWLGQFAEASGLTIDYFQNTHEIDQAFLSRYRLILQLDYPPYGWSETAAAAFENYIREGRGGWVGLHHASLLGEFDGFPMWRWFSEFLGGIRYANYIPGFARATVKIEAPEHPCMRGIPTSFIVDREEWYIYDRSPRGNVSVLAAVDESTYEPDCDVKMGDHPVVWTNQNVPSRNVYIFMGHGPELFDNPAYVTLLGNSILWACGK